MKLSVEKLPKSLVQLRVELTVEEVQPYVKRAARALSKEKTPKGFRPGSAPLEVMRSAVGDRVIVERAIQELVPRTYVEAIADRDDIEAIGKPEVEVEGAAMDGPCVYRATVAVLPEVTLGDYTNVRGARRAVTVEGTEVQQELEVLRAMRASFLTVPRPAQKGDRVEVDIAATADGAPLEAGPQRKQPFLLGESALVPGFEEHLIGMREGESKTFTVAFPPKHHRGDLRGRTVEFRVVMGTVQQRILPELDDRFAQGLGKFPTLAELREQLERNLRAERETQERERFRQELLSSVVERATFAEIPDALVERELTTMLAELEAGVADLGLPFDQYLLQIKKTREELREGLKPQALRRIRSGLVLRELGRAEKVAVTEEEVTDEVSGVLQTFSSPGEARKRLDSDALRDVAAAAVRNRKVFEHLEEIARKNGT